jgi:hypothetical protein
MKLVEFIRKYVDFILSLDHISTHNLTIVKNRLDLFNFCYGSQIDSKVKIYNDHRYFGEFYTVFSDEIINNVRGQYVEYKLSSEPLYPNTINPLLDLCREEKEDILEALQHDIYKRDRDLTESENRVDVAKNDLMVIEEKILSLKTLLTESFNEDLSIELFNMIKLKKEKEYLVSEELANFECDKSIEEKKKKMNIQLYNLSQFINALLVKRD